MVSRHKTDFWIKNNFIDVSVKDIAGAVDSHWHEFYEIEIILNGSGIYTIDGIDYEIKPGALFFMSPSSFHHIYFTENTKLINFMFTLEACDFDFMYGLFNSSPHICSNTDVKDMTFIHTLAKEMISADSPKYLKAVLNCVLGKIQKMHFKNTLSAKDTKMQYAILYIQNHFKENLRLNDVASIVNYTPNYFSNKFKECTGVTFKNYISDLQFSLVRSMLERTNLSITEICYNCGFRDFSNFMEAFKKRYGVSPKKFRDNMIAKNACL